MDRNGNVSSLYHSSYSEPEMDRKSDKEQIYSHAGCTDHTGGTDSDLYAGLHGQRYNFIPASVYVSGYQRGRFLGKSGSYDQCLLGIRADVTGAL